MIKNHKNKKARQNELTSFKILFACKRNKSWHRPTLPRVTAVPLALAGLTSLFGMGRGGHRRYRHLKIFNVDLVASIKYQVSRLILLLDTKYFVLIINNDILLKEVIELEKTTACSAY